jgi:SagB-type dehydrogenase family enzyme
MPTSVWYNIIQSDAGYHFKALFSALPCSTTITFQMKGTKMIQGIGFGILLLFLLAFSCNQPAQKIAGQQNGQPLVSVPLPTPSLKSNTSIEEALAGRRSIRRYKDEALELKEMAQLLWAAQGITSTESGGRTAPSAGALYPLELYVVCGKINTLPAGIYHYNAADHYLKQLVAGDELESLSAAAHHQGAINRSAAVIVIAADYGRTTRKYKEKGIRFVDMEAGHAAQNICLQAISLNIGTVTMGAFKDSLVKQLLTLPENQVPLYLLPVGKKRE